MNAQAISRRTLLQSTGVAMTGLALLNGGWHAQSAAAQSEGEVLPWLDQPVENPIPEVLKNVQSWEGVEKILDRSVDQVLGHLIYVVRDDQLIFYVGQSKRDVVVRFWEHMNKPSRLGELIALNKPRSLAWQVEFYALADCQPFVPQQSLFSMQEWQYFDMDMAEQGMIAHMRPVLNKDFNPQPTPLPSRYIGGSELDDPQDLSWQVTDRPWLNRMSLAGWVYLRDEGNGRIVWKHQSGIILTDDVVVVYRQQGILPPNHDG